MLYHVISDIYLISHGLKMLEKKNSQVPQISPVVSKPSYGNVQPPGGLLLHCHLGPSKMLRYRNTMAEIYFYRNCPTQKSHPKKFLWVLIWFSNVEVKWWFYCGKSSAELIRNYLVSCARCQKTVWQRYQVNQVECWLTFFAIIHYPLPTLKTRGRWKVKVNLKESGAQNAPRQFGISLHDWHILASCKINK